MSALSIFILILLISLIVLVLMKEWQKRRAQKLALEKHLYEIAIASLTDVKRSDRDSLGTFTYEGNWRGHHVQIRYIFDTLATRKLPVLWLSLSLFGTIKVDGSYDLMQRPAGLNSFSNFDQLPFQLPLPNGFNGQYELRSDDPKMQSDIAPSGVLYFMREPKAKELLVTKKGIRLVWTLSEASRVQYGVFRNANFDDIHVEKSWLDDRLQDLLTVQNSINDKEIHA